MSKMQIAFGIAIITTFMCLACAWAGYITGGVHEISQWCEASDREAARSSLHRASELAAMGDAASSQDAAEAYYSLANAYLTDYCRIDRRMRATWGERALPISEENEIADRAKRKLANK